MPAHNYRGIAMLVHQQTCVVWQQSLRIMPKPHALSLLRTRCAFVENIFYKKLKKLDVQEGKN